MGLNVKGGEEITKKEREIIKCQVAACAMEKNQQARGTCCLGESSGALEKVVEGVFSEKGALQQRSERHGAVRVSKRRE